MGKRKRAGSGGRPRGQMSSRDRIDVREFGQVNPFGDVDDDDGDRVIRKKVRPATYDHRKKFESVNKGFATFGNDRDNGGGVEDVEDEEDVVAVEPLAAYNSLVTSLSLKRHHAKLLHRRLREEAGLEREDVQVDGDGEEAHSYERENGRSDDVAMGGEQDNNDHDHDVETVVSVGGNTHRDAGTTRAVTEDMEDPFNTHFFVRPEQAAPTLVAVAGTSDTIGAYKGMVDASQVDQDATLPTPIADINHLSIQPRVSNAWSQMTSSGSLTPLQAELFAHFGQYRDVYFPGVPHEKDDEVRAMSCLHIVNHVMKARKRILRNHQRIQEKQKKRDGDNNNDDGHESNSEDDNDEDFENRDQGFTRPRVLILCPFKDRAWKYVDNLARLLKVSSCYLYSKPLSLQSPLTHRF